MANRLSDRRPWSPVSMMMMICAVLLLASCGGNDAPAAATPNAFDAQYSISGRLMTAAGAPLLGARATLRGSSMSGADYLGLDAVADSDGHYQFPAIPVGIYTVTASMPGYRFLVGGWSNVSVRDRDVVLPDLAAVAAP